MVRLGRPSPPLPREATGDHFTTLVRFSPGMYVPVVSANIKPRYSPVVNLSFVWLAGSNP